MVDQHLRLLDRRLVAIAHSIDVKMLSEHLPAAFIPLWILPNTFSGLSAGAFCIQFGVQGAWGVVSQLVALLLCARYRANIHGL